MMKVKIKDKNIYSHYRHKIYILFSNFCPVYLVCANCSGNKFGFRSVAHKWRVFSHKLHRTELPDHRISFSFGFKLQSTLT